MKKIMCLLECKRPWPHRLRHGQRPISVVVCLLALRIIAANPSFADVTVELTKTTPTGSHKETRYLTQKKIRIDVVEKDKTTISFIDPVNVLICIRANKPSVKGICTTLSTRDLKAMTSGAFSEKSSWKIASYKTTPLGKHGTFAGRRCDYFKRSYSMTIGDLTPGSTTEIFCTDRSLAREMMGLPEDALVNPLIASISDKKLRQQAVLSEKKALGLVIFTEKWAQPYLTPKAIDLKSDPHLPPDKDTEKQLKELDEMLKKMHRDSKKPIKEESNIATRVIVGPINPKVFQTPPPMHEITKNK